MPLNSYTFNEFLNIRSTRILNVWICEIVDVHMNSPRKMRDADSLSVVAERRHCSSRSSGIYFGCSVPQPKALRAIPLLVPSGVA